MKEILENIMKGFVQWINDLCIEIVEYIADALLDVFTMDLSYFRTAAPVTDDIIKVIIALGWALLLGNLVFQAIKSMTSGLGMEGEDPRLLFTRTFVFGFLLLASRQICEIGLNPAITGGLGRGFPGMLALAVIRNMGSSILKAAGNSAGTRHAPSGRSSGAGRTPGPRRKAPPSP